MVVCVAGGGTLGHIYPGLSIIKELRKKNQNITKVIFITTLKDQKYDLFKNQNLIDQTYFIDAQGFSTNIIKNIKTCYKTLKAYSKVKEILKKEKVDLVIGMGGYISGITLKAGSSLRLKTVIHEQNSVMGLANKLMLKKVDLILLTFPIQLREEIMKKTHLVGNPRIEDSKVKAFHKNKDFHSLLITSGTLGSLKVNELAIKFLKTNYAKNYQTTLITGTKYYDEVKKALANTNYGHFEIIPFVNDMLPYLNKNGIVISRAGSSTIFEIIGSNSIPILIPSPNVTANHQYMNAKYICDLGIGELIENEEDLKKLLDTLKKIETNHSIYLDKIKDYQKTCSIDKIIELINTLCDSKELHYGK